MKKKKKYIDLEPLNTHIEGWIAEAIEREREACAKIAEGFKIVPGFLAESDLANAITSTAVNITIKIRERGGKS